MCKKGKYTIIPTRDCRGGDKLKVDKVTATNRKPLISYKCQILNSNFKRSLKNRQEKFGCRLTELDKVTKL